MTIADPITDSELFTQDASTFTHIINCPPDKGTAEEWVAEARIFGLPVTAICGHVFVPQRDPIKHPVCQACIDAANIIVAEVNGA